MVPAHRGRKFQGAVVQYLGKGNHQIVETQKVDSPYRKRPKTEAEKKLAETIAGFTVIVDKANPKSHLRLKFGFNRLGQFQLNFIDQHGYAFVNFTEYELEDLMLSLMLSTGFLTKGRGPSNINIGKIEHDLRRTHRKITMPTIMAKKMEIMLWKYQELKRRRVALLKKRFGKNMPSLHNIEGVH